MAKSKIVYEGGSLRSPTEGLLIEEKHGDEYILVTFHPQAFNHDFTFRDDMIEALMQVFNSESLSQPDDSHHFAPEDFKS